MRYRADLTTPEAVARQLNTVNPDGSVPAAITDAATGQYTNFYAYVTDLCHQASDYIMAYCDRSFVPYVATLELPYRDIRVRGGRVPLSEDLMVLSSFSWGDSAFSASDYRLYPANVLPAQTIVVNTSSTTFGAVSVAWDTAYAITGTWGYHDNLVQAYTTIQAAFTSTSNETTITVTDASQFETLQYLRAESELMQVTAINTTDDELTVVRGVNGTTAAAHTAVPLQRFNVIPAIALCATRLVAYLYQKRTDVGGTVAFQDGTIVLDALPLIVRQTLNTYRRSIWLSA